MPRSRKGAKRQKLTRPPPPAMATLDIAIWTSIIEFLPMPKEVANDHVKVDRDTKIKNYEATVSEVLTNWRTLLSLRLVNEELAALLHPVDNSALWRRLVLQSFDFSRVKRGLGAGWLEEDLAKWSHLGIYHRTTQYGFLTELQQKEQPGSVEWPASEDAFTLFGDLVRLLQMPHNRLMRSGGEGSDPTFKFIGAPAKEVDASSATYGTSVMETLGYVSEVRSRGGGIGNAWKGFVEPDAFDANLKWYFGDKKPRGKAGNAVKAQSFESNDDFAFPDCKVGAAMRLYEFIHQHLQDWRSACCNEGSDGYTPVFFVGQSKASPHRWIGYVGQKCWT